ncbi:hypothetical protein [Streptomyces sp. CA-132043]
MSEPVQDRLISTLARVPTDDDRLLEANRSDSGNPAEQAGSPAVRARANL